MCFSVLKVFLIKVVSSSYTITRQKGYVKIQLFLIKNKKPRNQLIARHKPKGGF